ncbi:MAG: methyltransferase [Gammaproteobacteria bacterium]|nr:MAG: methyltransferase [Gammaproteobacteria bacterium]
MKSNLKFALVIAALMSLFHSANLFAGESSIDKAINGSHREMASKRDMYRHPKQTLEFFQVDETQTIIEVSPGGGWYTEILAPLVKDKGTFYAAHHNPDSESAYRQKSLKKFTAKLAANPELYSNVKMAIFSGAKDIQLGEPGTADRVLTFRNLHNWVGAKDEGLITIFKAFHTVLKKGGKLGLTDHRLPEDRTTGVSGYVKQSYAIKMAEAAGFTLEASSDINANAKDTVDYAKGVWTLPPTYALKDVDKEKYKAIGESNRMTLLFVKN